MRKIIKKLKSKRGESITEVLIALLVSTIALTILAGAIIAAGRINEKNDTQKVSFTISAADSVSTDKTAVISMDDKTDMIDVRIITDSQTGYIYYIAKED